MKISYNSFFSTSKQAQRAGVYLLSIIASVCCGPILTKAQPKPATSSENWTGSSGDGRWDNAANWYLSVSQAAYIPTATTLVNSQANTPPVLNLTTSAASNVTYSVFSLNMYAGDGPTLNLSSSGSGVLTFDITGDGIFNLTGNTNSRFRPNWVINVGKNAVLKYSKSYDDGTQNVQGNYGFIQMTENGVLDISAAKFGAGVTRNAWDSKIVIEEQNLVATTGTKILLGANALRTGGGQARDGVEIAANIDASGGGRILKGGSAYVIISGNNTFTDTLPASLHDSSGYVITNNIAPSAVNNLTHQNDYINNYFSLEDGGLLVVNSNLGPVRIANGDTNTLGGSGTVGSLLLERGVVSPGFGRNSQIIGTLTVNGNFEIRGTSGVVGSTSNTATLYIDLGVGGASDKLLVKGKAYIGASDGVTSVFPRLVIASPSGSVMPGRFTFLTAEGGIVGSFNPNFITTPTSLTLDAPVPVIVGNNYTLTITQKPFSSVTGLTSSQQVVAGYLDYLLTRGNPADASSYDPVLGVMNGKAIRNVTLTDGNGNKTYDTSKGYNPPETLALLQSSFNQLTPQSYVHLYEGAITNLNSTISDIESRTERAETGDGPKAFELYSTFNYGSVVTKTTLDYEEAKLKTLYYTIGGDKIIGDNLLIGGGLVHSSGNYQLDASGSTSKAKAYTLDAYAGYKLDRIMLGGVLFFGSDKYKTQRAVEKTRQADFVSSDSDGKRFGAGIWVDYAHKLGWFTFKPYCGLYWMDWDVDGFVEQGDRSVALTVRKQSVSFAQSKFGLRTESDFFARNAGETIFHTFVDISWIHLLAGGSARTIKSTLQDYPINVRTPSFDANGIRAGVGVSVDITKRLSYEIGASSLQGASVDHGFNYQTTVSYKF